MNRCQENGTRDIQGPLIFRARIYEMLRPPSASTRIRAWKDVPAWPVDTQDNARIKKRRRRDGVCYFWIKYGRDIKAVLESDLQKRSSISKAKYILLGCTIKIHKYNLQRNAIWD